MAGRKKFPSAALDVHLTKKKYFEIKFLSALELSSNGGLFASDFVEIAKEKDSAGMSLSESSVYNYLKEFQEKGILYYDKTTRKYHTTDRAKARFAVEQMIDNLRKSPESMLNLGWEVLEAANQQIREESKSPLRSETTIGLWGRWISAIALYCLGKEMETGESFWFVLANYLTYVGGPHAFLLRHIIYRATPNIEIKELIQLGKKGIAFGKKEVYAEEVASYFEDLKQIYPKQIETLERIFQNEGKQK